MKNDYTDNKFKELLDKLQQESWQLELLISGFAIFGLVSSLDLLAEADSNAFAIESFTRYLFPVAIICCKVLIVNLVIHVVLRGLWIGAIGLRYVSGDIDYEYLNYRKRFTNHLKQKVGSFDKYINTLENYCSILFALTFLILFYIISFFIVFFIMLLIGFFFMESGFFSEIFAQLFLGLFTLFFIFLNLIVFIDFVTQGYLKKKEWTSFLYFPLYKVFTVITLSFLYRPLVYNFLDNKFGKRLLLVLFPIYLFGFYLSTVSNVRSNYVIEKPYSSKNYSSANNYLNLIETNNYVRSVAIQSKVITEPYLKIFIPFRNKIEEIMLNQNKGLESIKDNRGFSSNFFLFRNKEKLADSLQAKYLKAFNKTYSLKIDNLYLESDFSITKINNQLGFETILPLKTIIEGKHLLKISRFIISKKTKKLESEDVIDIPFWYYKN